MASEQDAGRDKKITLGVLGIGIGVVVAILYTAWSYMNKPEAKPSQVNLERVSGAVPGTTSETPAYRAQLEQFNRQGAQQAQAENGSFIASLQLEKQPVAPVVAPPPPSKVETTARSNSNEREGGAGRASTSQDDERRQRALDAFLNKLNTGTVGLEPARLLGSSGADAGLGGGAGSARNGSDNGYQAWSQSLPGAQKMVNAGSTTATGPGTASASVVPIEVIPPYWRGPGYIDVGVDSDNSTTPVLARMDTGSYAGAVLKAPDGAKLTGDGVVIHFTEMAYRGINYTVDAYALQEDTLLANVATDVNHRYMSRIVLPALMSGIGGIGEMYAQANTQLVSNGFNSQVVRPSTPDGAAVLGSIAGGAAGQAAKVLSDDAQRVPARQVTITKGQVVAIQFMRGVYSADALVPGRGSGAVQAAVPAQTGRLNQGGPVTEDQWRIKAQQQIEHEKESNR